MSVLSKIPTIAKAIVAAATGFGAAFAVAIQQTAKLTMPDWITIAVATIIAAGAVWAVPNAPATPAPEPGPLTSPLS